MDVRQIDYSDTKEFILNVHYARRMPSISYAYGLFDTDDSMLGVVTYGSPASPNLCKGVAGEENRKNVIELNRLVIDEKAPQNAASLLVGRSLRLLPKGLFVVSYADWGGWGHIGYVYQATNWLYTGLTKRRTDMKSISGGHPRHYKQGETQRVVRTEKHRYITFTGNKKRMRKLLKYPVMDYPKGDSRRYDTKDPIGILDMWR